MNTFGNNVRLTTFGESHGFCVGGVLDGLPAGLPIDKDAVKRFMEHRKPGNSTLTSERNEKDEVSFLSGLTEASVTTGAPIAFLIENRDVRSADYTKLQGLFRPGHADYTYFAKYGLRPLPGGGRSSARETAVRCVAGAIASQWLARYGIRIMPFVCQIGDISVSPDERLEPERAYEFATRCPNPSADQRMAQLIESVRAEGNSIGGCVACIVEGVPEGWGEPIYNKLSARLSYAMMSINGAKGFETGDGFALASMRGSEANDAMEPDNNGKPRFLSNHSGGILGGISTGQPLFFKIAFKPTPTIHMAQRTITTDGKPTTFIASGRHDPCIALRATAVVEAMTALVLADFLALAK